jgi:hypothetical protein
MLLSGVNRLDLFRESLKVAPHQGINRGEALDYQYIMTERFSNRFSVFYIERFLDTL